MSDLKKALEYVYKTKNGLKEDLINKFDKEIYESLTYSNLIIPCVRVNGSESWKISKSGYDLYITTHPDLKYKTIFTRFMDFLDNLLIKKSSLKEYKINENIKRDYFNETRI